MKLMTFNQFAANIGFRNEQEFEGVNTLWQILSHIHGTYRCRESKIDMTYVPVHPGTGEVMWL